MNPDLNGTRDRSGRLHDLGIGGEASATVETQGMGIGVKTKCHMYIFAFLNTVFEAFESKRHA